VAPEVFDGNGRGIETAVFDGSSETAVHRKLGEEIGVPFIEREC
jgi:hypothetical protein